MIRQFIYLFLVLFLFGNCFAEDNYRRLLKVATSLGSDLDSEVEIIIAGSFTEVNGVEKVAIAKVNGSGNLIESFNVPFLSVTSVDAITAIYDYFVVIGGEFITQTNNQNLEAVDIVTGSLLGRVYTASPVGKVTHIGNIRNRELFVGYDNDVSGETICYPCPYNIINIGEECYDAYMQSWEFDGAYMGEARCTDFNFGYDATFISDEFVMTTTNRRVSYIAKRNSDLVRFEGQLNSVIFSRNPNYNPNILPKNQYFGPIFTVRPYLFDSVLVGGYFTAANGAIENIGLIDKDGLVNISIDFDIEDVVFDIQPLDNNYVIVGGAFTSINHLAKFYVDPSLTDNPIRDINFSPNINGVVKLIRKLPSGNIIIVGDFTEINGVFKPYIAKLNSAGELITTFNVNVSGPIYDIEILE